MLKYALAAITGVALTGNVYMAGWGGHCKEGAEDCCAVAPSEPTAAAFPANLVDMKNTKCIVMKDDVGTSKGWVQFEGKLYHTCCPDCVETFNKDPQKYVKALEAKPEEFGIKK